jgi:quinol monooxygenase YgiN
MTVRLGILALLDAKPGYGIFDTFNTEDARDAHLAGPIPQALGEVAPDLLAGEPNIRMAELVAVK